MAGGAYRDVADFKQAAAPHAERILKSLNVDYAGDAKHVFCPNPNHADSRPSFRFDTRIGSAFCTCDDMNGADLIGLVEALKGCDFRQACDHIAEVAGIEPMRWRTGGQKQSAEALLNPPADNRDDSLVGKYLGYRLGIDPADVIMPTTPVRGIKSLDYFDVSQNGAGKPQKFGAAPCAVFGIVGHDGDQHAMRIWLGQNGQGKADFGEGRDVKKLCRADGKRIAGFATMFGVCQSAETLILCEGIETAAAVAYAVREKLEAGAVAVAASLSTSGMKAYRPASHVKQIIVCADRDEGGLGLESAGAKAGERAARAFAIKYYEEYTVCVFLPGTPGKKVDALDFMLKHGPEALLAGLQEASEFEPTVEDRAARKAQQHADDALSRAMERYPLPEAEGFNLRYEASGDGQVRLTAYDSKAKSYFPVSSPIAIPARLRVEGKEIEYGLRVVVEGMDGQPCRIDLMRGDLARFQSSDFKERLLRAGVRFFGKGEGIIAALLKAVEPAAELVVGTQPGWHWPEGGGDPVFLTPAGTLIGAEGGTIELIQNAIVGEQFGTLDGWKAATKAAATQDHCPHFILGLVAGFVGPLVALTRDPKRNYGINLSGLTSTGKTTAQRLSVATWSSPDFSGGGLMQSANATVNSAEFLLRRANASVFVLDEVGFMSGKSVADLIYMAAQGMPKGRLTKDIQLRDRDQWISFAFLSSEISLEDHIKDNGERWRGGMAARFTDVDVTGVNNKVPAPAPAFDQINNIRQHYGHAGPAFVTKLIDGGIHRQPEKIAAKIDEAARKLAGDRVGGQWPRATLPLAALLVAGGFARSFGLLPVNTPIEHAVQWAWDAVQGSHGITALDPAATAIENLQQWILSRWRSSIINVHDIEDRKSGGKVDAWFDGDCVYLPAEVLVQAAGGVLARHEILRALNARGLIGRKRDGNRFALRYVPNVGSLSAYALSRRAFGSNKNEEPDVRSAS